MTRGCARAAAGAVIVLVATVAGFALWVKRDMDFYERYVPALQRDLGFEHGSPIVQVGGRPLEVMTLHPLPGGPMHQAGVRDGDIVVDERVTMNFYRTLEASRGGEVRFVVVDGSDGPLLADRSRRQIRLRVP